jgi:hypothetical protein
MTNAKNCFIATFNKKINHILSYYTINFKMSHTKEYTQTFIKHIKKKFKIKLI